MGQHNRKSPRETAHWESHFTNTCIEEPTVSLAQPNAPEAHTTKEANHHVHFAVGKLNIPSVYH